MATGTLRAVRGRLVACLQHGGGYEHQRLFGIYRWGWGFSTSQDINGDVALIACFAAAWTPDMVRRWHADPFGFLRPWNEVPALMGSPPPQRPLDRHGASSLSSWASYGQNLELSRACWHD
jgi:hypothetical protein